MRIRGSNICGFNSVQPAGLLEGIKPRSLRARGLTTCRLYFTGKQIYIVKDAPSLSPCEASVIAHIFVI
jgi:hypothetical protein